MVEKIPAAVTLDRLKQLQWSKVFHMCYVEPVVFTLVFGHMLSGTVMKHQIIYQACSTVFHYNDSDCKELGKSNSNEYLNAIETEVQPYVANLLMMRTLLESIVPTICGVFIGSWSDHYGRKPLLLISMIGFSFTYLITAAVCEISAHYPVNPWYYILGAVPHSILGGNCVFSVAIFCFISDVTDSTTRPFRMILLEVIFFSGLTSGSLLSSYVYAATNATITFIISGVLVTGATVFVAVCVPESLNLAKEQEKAELEKQQQLEQKSAVPPQIEDPKLKLPTLSGEEKIKEGAVVNGKEEAKAATAEQEQKDNEQKAATLFSYVHIKNMLETCLKKRPYYDRCIIWLVMGTMFVSMFVVDGIMSVFYLFVREKFHWSVREFTFYESMSHMVPVFGAIVGFLVLRNLFNMSVVTLALLAVFSNLTSNLMKGLATEPWHLYLSIAFGIFHSIGGAMCRTIVSNIVPATDLGKIFSIKNILQCIAPFVAAPLYTYIYKASLLTYPGLFNIVSAGLFVIAFIFMSTVLYFKYAYKEHYSKILN